MRHEKPVGKGEHESLHQIKQESRLLLISEESLIDHSIVLEFSQH